jgi:hypothetical protein
MAEEPVVSDAVVNSEEQSSAPQSDEAAVHQAEENGTNVEAPQSQPENTENAPSTESAQPSKPKPPASGRHDTTLTPGFAFLPCYFIYVILDLNNPSRRKIFVGGIGPEVVEADMKEYFGSMGEITDVVVMKGDIINFC